MRDIFYLLLKKCTSVEHHISKLIWKVSHRVLGGKHNKLLLLLQVIILIIYSQHYFSIEVKITFGGTEGELSTTKTLPLYHVMIRKWSSFQHCWYSDWFYLCFIKPDCPVNQPPFPVKVWLITVCCPKILVISFSWTVTFISCWVGG